MKTLCEVTLFFKRLDINKTSTATVLMMLDLNSPEVENSIYEFFGNILHMELYDYEITDLKKLKSMTDKD